MTLQDGEFHNVFYQILTIERCDDKMSKNDPKIAKCSKIRSRISKLGKYVMFSIGFVVLYTIAVLCNFVINGVEPSTLAKCVYGFFAGEVTIAALIKIFNIKLIERPKTEMEESEEFQE